jgi:hypothetical protein
MKRNIKLASRLREVFLTGHWIANTNYKEQLQNVNWQEATRKIADLNTIAALTFHINYYLGGLLSAFKTGKLEIRDKYSFDHPAIASGDDWNRLIEEFLGNAEKFTGAIEEMEDAIFDRPFIDEKYGSYLRNIEGVIEHSYYHLGQIVLIRKLIASREVHN